MSKVKLMSLQTPSSSQTHSAVVSESSERSCSCFYAEFDSIQHKLYTVIWSQSGCETASASERDKVPLQTFNFLQLFLVSEGLEHARTSFQH